MATVKTWIAAARLRTLPLALSSILVGTSIAAQQGALSYSIAGLTLLTAILLQVLSNFANDYGDAVSGVDSSERDGPSRTVQSGAISRQAMKGALVLFAILTLLSGLLLLYVSFPGDWLLTSLFLGIGLVAIAAAIKYTVGRSPYGYSGFGDFFVFVFFGLVAVVGTFFLQTKTFGWQELLPGSSLGLLAVGVLNINNIRDIESDRIAGKNSIPVRIGRERAIVYHGLLLFLGLGLMITYLTLSYSSWPQFLFLLTIPLLASNFFAVRNKPATQLDPHLKQMALATLLFALLFAVGQYFS